MRLFQSVGGIEGEKGMAGGIVWRQRKRIIVAISLFEIDIAMFFARGFSFVRPRSVEKS